ncbi:MAG: hypothetical protein ACP5JP_09675 [bacterium]
MRSNKRCPFLKIELCGYCSLFPIKKMIPVEKMKTACACLSECYSDCPQFIEAGSRALNVKHAKASRRTGIASEQNMKGG